MRMITITGSTVLTADRRNDTFMVVVGILRPKVTGDEVSYLGSLWLVMQMEPIHILLFVYSKDCTLNL